MVLTAILTSYKLTYTFREADLVIRTDHERPSDRLIGHLRHLFCDRAGEQALLLAHDADEPIDERQRIIREQHLRLAALVEDRPARAVSQHLPAGGPWPQQALPRRVLLQMDRQNDLRTIRLHLLESTHHRVTRASSIRIPKMPSDRRVRHAGLAQLDRFTLTLTVLHNPSVRARDSHVVPSIDDRIGPLLPPSVADVPGVRVFFRVPAMTCAFAYVGAISEGPWFGIGAKTVGGVNNTDDGVDLRERSTRSPGSACKTPLQTPPGARTERVLLFDSISVFVGRGEMLSRLVRSRVGLAIVSSAVTAALLGGIAWAAIPGTTSGQIAACYPTSGPAKGQLRVIDYQSGQRCRAGERLLRWSQRGMRFRGPWTPSESYQRDDVVTHDGAAYVATGVNIATTPPNLSHWVVLSPKPHEISLCSGFPRPQVDWSLPGSSPGNGCDFSGATFEGLDLHGANLENANLAETRFKNAYHVNGVRITDLTDANLTGTDLRGAALANDVNFSRVDFSEADLTGADLPGANIQFANMTNADLTDANLAGTHMPSVDLTGANMTNANIAGANMSGVTWSMTTCPDGTRSDTNGTKPQSCVGHL